MPLTLNEDDRDYPALVVANRILGSGSLQSRLGIRIRQRDGLSYALGSWLSAGRWHAATQTRDQQGALDIEAIAAPQNVDRVETAIREELERFVREGVTAQELNDAVSGLQAERKQQRAEDKDLVALLSRQSAMGRTMAWEADFDARLRALTVDAVNAAIRQHLKPETLSVFAAGDFPESAENTPSAE
jgi:zinc protease